MHEISHTGLRSDYSDIFLTQCRNKYDVLHFSLYYPILTSNNQKGEFQNRQNCRLLKIRPLVFQSDFMLVCYYSNLIFSFFSIPTTSPSRIVSVTEPNLMFLRNLTSNKKSLSDKITLPSAFTMSFMYQSPHFFQDKYCTIAVH